MRGRGHVAILWAVGVLAACAPQSRTPELSDAVAKAEVEKQRQIAVQQKFRAV